MRRKLKKVQYIFIDFFAVSEYFFGFLKANCVAEDGNKLSRTQANLLLLVWPADIIHYMLDTCLDNMRHIYKFIILLARLVN